MPQQMGEAYASFHPRVPYTGAIPLHSEKQGSRHHILVGLFRGEKAQDLADDSNSCVTEILPKE